MTLDRRTILRLAGACLPLGASLAAAQAAYPTRPITLIVPFVPGGPTDVLGRLLAQRLGEALGQPMVVDNRAGAGGTIGAELVAKAPPDGYVLLYGSTSTLAISPAVYKSLRYDPARAFDPVALVSVSQQLLVVPTALGVGTLAELVALAKRAAQPPAYSSPGNGTPGHLATEMLKSLTGMSAVHVPYRGGAPALQAVLSGEVQFMVDAVPTSLPFLRGGRLKALAMLSPRRSELLPTVPTVKEAGFADISADFWSGLVAPAGTPPAVLVRLNEEIRKIASSADFQQRLAAMGAEPQSKTPEAFASFVKDESRKWSALAEAAGVKPE